ILECFLKHKNQVLNRSKILEKLWNSDNFSGEETIKTHITNIRRKLKSVGASEDLIATVYGVGYRLNTK
ncbi:MAG: helix-turn-helix domain-containing protein, partial [Rhizonema sp. NSF051]|nr:helix-turn-helix domain-containing protein [Rhizonema sp. NSF051]